MRMFESVVVVTDPCTLELGLAIRASLEAFRLHVDFHQCVQRQRLRSVLGGGVAPADWVVLCVAGWHAPEPESLNFVRMVDRVDGRWTEVSLRLTPEVIRETVRLSGRNVVVAGGCNAGTPSLASAFLDSGCHRYIAPERSLDADAAVLFTIALFYHLLQEERDPSAVCSVEQAVARAAAVDAFAREGTHLYSCFACPSAGCPGELDKE